MEVLTVSEEKRSTHKTEVVRIKLDPLEGTDNLALVRVFNGGHQIVVNKHQWKDGDLGAYILPDSVVDTSNPLFEFLRKEAKEDGTYRVRAKKLRQVWSEGLMVPAPEGSREGDDVAELLGVTRYERPEPGDPGAPRGKGLFGGGEVGPSPSGLVPKYDLESWSRFKDLFVEGEEVVITEKCDGSNARLLFQDSVMYVGSREEWKKEYASYEHITKEYLLSRGAREEEADKALERIKNKKPQQNMWWKMFRSEPSIQQFCQNFPGWCLYGECYGQVGGMEYGTGQGVVKFAAFDVWDVHNKVYLEFDLAADWLDYFKVPRVPVLYRGPYSETKVLELTDGSTTIGGTHCREGVVIRPVKNRYDMKAGRVVLKRVSNDYLVKKGRK